MMTGMVEMWSLAVDTNLEHTEQTKEMAMQVSSWYKLEGSYYSACGSISNKTRSSAMHSAMQYHNTTVANRTKQWPNIKANNTYYIYASSNQKERKGRPIAHDGLFLS
jgi:uncharacterized protein YceK